MSKLVAFFKLIRLPNLVMLGLVMLITNYSFCSNSIPYSYLILLIFATILIASSGFIINDIKDFEIDKLNKPDSNFINLFRKKELYFAFFLFSFLGLGFGLYVSSISNFKLFYFFGLAYLSLIFYSFFLSKFKPLGNVLISALIVAVIFLVVYFESYLPISHKAISDNLFYTFQAYILLAFLSNWSREIVKDIEDLEGDNKFGRKTLPILFGINSSLFIVLFFNIIVTILIIVLIIMFKYYLLISVLILQIFLFKELNKAKEIRDFKRISYIIKIIMLFGILFPLF